MAIEDKELTELTALTTPAVGDVQHIVDVSDTTDSTDGTSKKITLQNIANWLAALAQTLTNKTLTSPVLNTGISGTAFLDENDMTSDSATKVASQQSIKAYVDSVSSDVVDDTTPQLGGDLDMNSHSIDFPSTPNISDVKDEDNMSSNSATMLATQQSIKKYIDDQVSTQIANVVEDLSPQLGANLDMNEFQITEDTNAKLRMQYIAALADGGIVALDGGGVQILFIVVDASYSGIYSIRGGYNGTSEYLDPTNSFSVTKDGAASINIYYDSGYKIQNKTGGARNITLASFGVA